MITASRLLKSWAIPPASCPRLSRRWAWCSWFSSRCRSASVSSRSRSRAATTRSLTSRMAAITSVPSSVSMLDRLISAGNSPPSRRRPNSSSPPPIGRVRGSAKYPARTERCESRKRSGTSTSTGCPTSSSRAYPNSASTWALTSTISPSRPTPTIASGKSSSRAVCIASSRNRAVGSASAAVTRSWWPLCIRPEFHIPGLFHLDSVPPYARAGHDAGSCEYTNQCNKWCDLFARAGFAGGGGAHRGVERPRTSSGPGSGASGCAEQPRELVRQGERVKRLGDHPGRAETFQASPVRALRLGGQEYDGHPRRSAHFRGGPGMPPRRPRPARPSSRRCVRGPGGRSRGCSHRPPRAAGVGSSRGLHGSGALRVLETLPDGLCGRCALAGVETRRGLAEPCAQLAWRRHAGRAGGARAREREREAEAAALPWGAVGPEAPAVALDDAAGDGQAETAAALLAGVGDVDLVEALEDRVELVGRYAPTAVGDGEQGTPIAAADRDRHEAF